MSEMGFEQAGLNRVAGRREPRRAPERIVRGPAMTAAHAVGLELHVARLAIGAGQQLIELERSLSSGPFANPLLDLQRDFGQDMGTFPAVDHHGHFRRAVHPAIENDLGAEPAPERRRAAGEDARHPRSIAAGSRAGDKLTIDQDIQRANRAAGRWNHPPADVQRRARHVRLPGRDPRRVQMKMRPFARKQGR
jgi:hypothetical protein